MKFNDRRPEPVTPKPKLKADLHGHLINDHEHTYDSVGSSNPPSAVELKRIHSTLHYEQAMDGGDPPDRHIHPDEVERRAKGWPLTDRYNPGAV